MELSSPLENFQPIFNNDRSCWLKVYKYIDLGKRITQRIATVLVAAGTVCACFADRWLPILRTYHSHTLYTALKESQCNIIVVLPVGNLCQNDVVPVVSTTSFLHHMSAWVYLIQI